MGAEAFLAKHASQSSVLNQGCVLMSATPPLRFPNLLLKSACACAEPVGSCYQKALHKVVNVTLQDEAKGLLQKMFKWAMQRYCDISPTA